MPPRVKARLAGLFYLVTIVAGIYAQGVVAERLFASTDATATAANVLAHTTQFRTGFAVYLVEMSAQLVMTALIYELLRPVSRSVALLSALFGFVGCTIKIVARLFYYAPIVILSGSAYLTVFSREQLNALALLLLKVNDQGAALALFFFDVATLLKAYLILRSTFWPRFLGVLAALGGAGWLAYVWPPLGARIFVPAAALGLLGAVATIAWLLIVGIDEERWTAEARAAAARLG